DAAFFELDVHGLRLLGRERAPLEEASGWNQAAARRQRLAEHRTRRQRLRPRIDRRRLLVRTRPVVEPEWLQAPRRRLSKRFSQGLLNNRQNFLARRNIEAWLDPLFGPVHEPKAFNDILWTGQVEAATHVGARLWESELHPLGKIQAQLSLVTVSPT